MPQLSPLEREERAMLRTILENPSCDSSRLIYADWLEEHGCSERAELIRLQLCDADHSARVGELLRKHDAAWFPEERLIKNLGIRYRIVWVGGFVEEIYFEPTAWGYGQNRLRSWLSIAGAVCSRQPLNLFLDANWRPMQAADGTFTWERCYRGWPQAWQVTESLHRVLRDRSFHTAEAALQGLSQACVNLGRKQAGLPELIDAGAIDSVPA